MGSQYEGPILTMEQFWRQTVETVTWSLMHSQGAEVNELAVLFSFFILSIQPRISSHEKKLRMIKLSVPTSVKIT